MSCRFTSTDGVCLKRSPLWLSAWVEIHCIRENWRKECWHSLSKGKLEERIKGWRNPTWLGTRKKRWEQRVSNQSRIRILIFKSLSWYWHGDLFVFFLSPDQVTLKYKSLVIVTTRMIRYLKSVVRFCLGSAFVYDKPRSVAICAVSVLSTRVYHVNTRFWQEGGLLVIETDNFRTRRCSDAQIVWCSDVLTLNQKHSQCGI